MSWKATMWMWRHELFSMRIVTALADLARCPLQNSRGSLMAVAVTVVDPSDDPVDQAYGHWEARKRQ